MPPVSRALLQAFARTISLESHNLARWPHLLRQQCLNRLRWTEGVSSQAAESPSAEPANPRLVVLARAPFRESSALERTLRGHSHGVNACTVTPDGQRVISAGRDKTLRVWDLSTGAELMRLAGHSQQVTSCAVSADGRLLLSGGNDNTILIWDLAGGGPEILQATRQTGINDCAMSPDGSSVVLADDDGAAVAQVPIATSSGAELRAWGSGAATSCAIAADAKLVVVGRADGTVGIRQLDDQEERRELVALAGQTLDDRALWVPLAREVKDVSDPLNRLVVSLAQSSDVGVADVAISPDVRFVVSAAEDGLVRLWDTRTGRDRATLAWPPKNRYEDPPSCAAIAPDARLVAVGSGNAVRIFRHRKRGTIWRDDRVKRCGPLVGHVGEVSGVAITPDASRLVSASSDGTLKVWRLDGAADDDALAGHTGEVARCAVSPDGNVVASASADGTLRIWELDTLEQRHVLEHRPGQPTRAVTGCAMSPDSQIVLSIGSGQVMRWDLRTGSVLDEADTPGDDCATSPDGTWFVSADGGRETLTLWDWASNEPRRTLPGHRWSERCAVHPNGAIVVSVGHDGCIRTWDVETCEQLDEATVSSFWVHDCAVSPDGAFVLASVTGGDLHVRSMADLRNEITTLEGHGAGPCAVTPDARFVATASHDATVTIWNASNWTQIGMVALPSDATCVVTHPRSPAIVCADGAGGVYVLDLLGLEYGPSVVTILEVGNELRLRCPACSVATRVERSVLGELIACPAGCSAQLRVNPFTATAPSWVTRT